MLVNYAPAHLPGPEAWLRTVTGPLLNITVAGIAGRLPALGLALLLLAGTALAARGIGGPLVRWLAPSLRRAPARRWLALAIGLGALPLPHLGAGLLGFHTRAGVLLVLAAAALSGLRGRWPRHPRITRAPPAPGAPIIPADPVVRATLMIGAVAAAWTQAAALLAGFAPAQVSDEFVAHLGLPGWWAAHHRIVPQPGNVFSAFPAGASLLFAPWTALGLDFGTAWPHQLAGWLLAGGIWWLTSDRAPAIRILATLGVLTLPAVWIFAGRAFADLFPAALGAAALVALRSGHPGLAGLAAGLAAGTKYQAWLLLPMLLALTPARRWPTLLTGALAAAAPWLARGWLGAGDPLHPLLWRFLGQPGWDAALGARVARGLQQDPAVSGLASLPALPWLVPVRTIAAGSDGTAGILAALLVPALWLAPRPREAVALLAFALPAALTGSGIRFLLPALPLLAAVAARGWERAADAFPLRVASCAAALLLGWQAAEIVPAGWRAYDDPLAVALGAERVNAYRDRTAYPREVFPPGWFRAAPPAATRGRILVTGSWGGIAPCPGRAAYITPLFDRPLPVTLARGAAGPDRMAVAFRQAGIGTVLASRWRGEVFFDAWRCWDWSARELRDWAGFWDRHAHPAGPAAVDADWWTIDRVPRRQPHRVTPGFEAEALRLVVALASWGRIGDGVAVLAKLDGLFPGNPEYHAARAVIAGARGLTGEADLAAATAVRIAPRSAAAARARGEAALVRGRLDEARRALHESATRDGWNSFVWLQLSTVCHRLGRSHDAWWALQGYRRAKSGGPEW